jgi:pimeloyl-ACP methyl ester carboxylesterase
MFGNSMADSEVRDDDEPVRLQPGLAPEMAAPLAQFRGAEPASPAWFKGALARAPERNLVPVRGANIELLTWGKIGNPGLIFVHGNSAHADWWSFIAPFFMEDYRVAALSLSGMGGSDWRETYSFEIFADEIHACARAAGLYEAAAAPIYVGHSFGGSQVYYSAARYRERMRGCILVDTGFGAPPTPEQIEEWERQERAAGGPAGRWRGPAHRTQSNRVYATLEEALARFRLMPPQVPGNLYVADHIARHSLKRAPMAGGSDEGWTWRFDPFLWSKLDRSGMEEVDSARAAPLAHIWGDRSEIIRRHNQISRGKDFLPPEAPRIVIPDSEHHIMIDQPLALVAALRALMSVWPSELTAALSLPTP